MKCSLCDFEREENFPYDSEGLYCPKCQETQHQSKPLTGAGFSLPEIAPWKSGEGESNG